MTTSKVENSAQVLSCQLKFVHGMAVVNTLAYYDTATITATKSLIVQAQSLSCFQVPLPSR